MAVRRYVVAAVVAAAALLAIYAARSRDTRRGVLLITLDTVRADHLSCYGYPVSTTPFLDSLAAKGVRFEQAVAVSSNTPVSHASILTGLYPPHNGVRFIHGFDALRLANGVPTMASLFAKAGYSTAGFVSAFPLVADRYGLNRGFWEYDDGVIKNRDTAITADGFVAIKENQRAGDETIARFLAWLTREKPRRFLAWIHLFDAHDSILKPPQSFAEEFEKRERRSEGERRRHWNYDLEIAYMDELLRRLSVDIDRLFPWDHIQVVVVADHGEGLGEHGYERHTLRIYQEQLHVPLIFAGPGIPEGVRVGDRVSAIDIMPTLLDLDGIAAGRQMDGVSLTSLMKGQRRSEVCYAEALAPLSVRQEALFAIIRDGQKLLYAPQTGRYELYDLARDPHEISNMYGTARGEGIFPGLWAALKKYPLSIDFKREKPLTPEDEQKLRSLGYL